MRLIVLILLLSPIIGNSQTKKEEIQEFLKAYHQGISHSTKLFNRTVVRSLKENGGEENTQKLNEIEAVIFDEAFVNQLIYILLNESSEQEVEAIHQIISSPAGKKLVAYLFFLERNNYHRLYELYKTDIRSIEQKNKESK